IPNVTGAGARRSTSVAVHAATAVAFEIAVVRSPIFLACGVARWGFAVAKKPPLPSRPPEGAFDSRPRATPRIGKSQSFFRRRRPPRPPIRSGSGFPVVVRVAVSVASRATHSRYNRSRASFFGGHPCYNRR
ncbi:hypothetical protein TIFTF001_055319, partial [Ficus carica]